MIPGDGSAITGRAWLDRRDAAGRENDAEPCSRLDDDGATLRGELVRLLGLGDPGPARG